MPDKDERYIDRLRKGLTSQRCLVLKGIRPKRLTKSSVNLPMFLFVHWTTIL